MSAWHSKSPGSILAQLDTDRSRGLTEAQAKKRLEQHGPNTLAQPKQASLILRLLSQLKDPMILVLLAAAALSFFASGFEDWVEPLIILVIVAVNAAISISQEDNAQKALDALRNMSAPLAKVIRDGKVRRIETAALVPGDIIMLEAGDLIPADARILECAALKTDESSMTGESIPVSKQALDYLPEETPLGDRSNSVISATVVTNGRALCVVTETGMNTEMGRIAGLLQSTEDNSTPLQLRMVEISKLLSVVCLFVCAITFGVGLFQGKKSLKCS